jgi:hypothetical protein
VLRGMNIPLMNTRGNLTRDEIIIILDGAFVGGTDNNNPKDEKHAPARIIPNIRINGWTMSTPNATPRAIGTIVIPIPKDAITSPKI